MKIYTLFELQQMPGYSILKNILNEGELQHYFNTPPSKRGSLADKVIIRKPRFAPNVNPITIIAPTYTPVVPTIVFPPVVQPRTPTDTHLCTSIQSINTMAQDFMVKTFIVDGVSYRMNDLGWRFGFNNAKSSFGWCSPRRKKIELSQWMIQNTKNDMAFWIDTMLHEIAHAIDNTKRGTSDHSWKWKAIARAVGCNAERTGMADYAENINSKYTTTCPKCNNIRPRHKMTRSLRFGRTCCGKCYKKTGNMIKLICKQNY